MDWTMCCNSYRITCSTLPITPLSKIISFYINCSNQPWNKIADSTKLPFHVMFIWMFLINYSNWSIFVHFNDNISLDVKVKKESITNFASIVNKSCKCDLCHLGELCNLVGRWNFIIWLIMSIYIIFGFCNSFFNIFFKTCFWSML